jgi:serine/threonine protein kinase/Flp pilus assembly protein TadD
MQSAAQPIESILAAAVELNSEAERQQFLDQACAGDVDLKKRLQQLIDNHFRAGSFLESPVALAAPHGGEGLRATVALPISEVQGTIIGPYKLLEQIGEGGFGIVFMAEQQEPIRRKVALKVLKPGMDSRQVVGRFEAERQALAIMDHPNIAKVLDGGQTSSSRPYFVMDLVKGLPITEYCDQAQLTTRERLEMFLPLCQAVQHAHQKGIIHRDLKPSNVLVTLQVGTPLVKVIDFGIAKAVGQQLTDKTWFTGFAQMIGTPLYMSPEQAALCNADVDTRSDIYSLGVLLYELLTGTTPFGKDRLKEIGYDELRRIIREEEPPRPSTRISTLGKAATTLSTQRKSDPKRLSQFCRGELDWIVMKCLEKDRNRRYETAGALAADVLHFLHDEPVQACPPSKWYRFRKLARRKKRAFVTASALALGALVAVIGLAASNVLIRQEQARTKEAKERAEKAQGLAEQRAEQIRDGLERLKTANALSDRARFYTADLRWDDAHAVLTRAVQLRPDHSFAWAELADLHTRLGLWELAASDFEREMELRKPDDTLRWYLHALLRVYLGDTPGYGQVCRRMREHFRGTSQRIFLIELVRTSVLRPDADADLEQLVEQARQAVAAGAKGEWWPLYTLGVALYRAGQHEKAMRRLRESLAVDQREWSVRTLSYPVLAMAYYRLGRVAEAREALKASARVLNHWTEEMYQGGDKHWVIHLGAAAYWPVPWWDWMEGRLYYREAKLLIDGSPPPDDPRLHVLRGRAFAGLREHAQAEPEYAVALQQLPDDPQIRLETHRNRAYGYIHLSRWKHAAAEFAQAGELQPDEVYLGLFRGVAHLKAGEVGAYRQTCAALVRRFEKTQDPVIASNLLLACVLRPDALPDMARLLPLVRVATPPGAPGPAEAAAALYRAGKYAEAIRRFEMAAKVYRLRAGAWCFLAMARHRLGRADEARHALAEAVRWIDEANRDESDELPGRRPAWGSWHEKLECEFLLDEATKLLEKNDADCPDSGVNNPQSRKKRD